MEHGAIRVGTCSWAEKSAIESGSFYPQRVSTPEQRLRFYASRFDCVEVDSSYYSLPTRHMAEAWAERTPPAFLFHVKAYGALTGHNIDARHLPDRLRKELPAARRREESLHVEDPQLLRVIAQELLGALVPLREARKLGFVIFQYPPWFTCTSANRDYLVYCKELMAGVPVAVEFRHGSWLTRRHAPETLAFLREHHITYITCDEPQCGDLRSVPLLPENTTGIGYLRLHGRNAEAWLNRCGQSPAYRYDDKELEQMSLLVRRLSSRVRTTFVMFNNSHCGHSLRNALQLKSILAGMGRTPALRSHSTSNL